MFNAQCCSCCCRPCHSSLCSTHECTCVTRERRTRDNLAASLFAHYTMTTHDSQALGKALGTVAISRCRLVSVSFLPTQQSVLVAATSDNDV
ncbi:hypothetical protein CaCOL14_005478 [Colletotrichum acutatum]